MTMNPHTTSSQLRTERLTTQNARAAQLGPSKAAKRSLAPAALISAGFILAVSLIAKVFYD